MNVAHNATSSDKLSLSLRLMRLLLSILLFVIIGTEFSLSGLWQLVLVTLALYALVTGLFGSDPVFVTLGLSTLRSSDHELSIAAQLECLAIGLTCIAAGVMNRDMDSVTISVLPFVGVYAIVICAVRHDLLGYLIKSYQKQI